MFNFFKSLSVFVFLLWVGVVQAAEIRTLQYVSDETFEAFFIPMKKNGWAHRELGINIDGMANIAFGDAKVVGLVTDSDKEAFIKLFRQRHGLTGEYISAEAFRAISSGKGFYTGSLADLRQAMSNPAPVAKVAPADTALQQLRAENEALAKKVGESKQDIAVLESKQIALDAGLKAVNESKNSLKQLLDSVNNKVNALRNGRFTATMGEAIDEQAKALFETKSAAQQKTDAAQDTKIAEAKSAATDASIAAKGAASTVDWFVSSFSVWFLLLTIVVVGVVIWLGVMSKKVWKLGNVVFGKGTIPGLSKEVKDLLEDREIAEKDAGKVEERFSGLEQSHQQLKATLGDLQQSHEQLINRVGRYIDEELIQPNKLKALPIGGRIEVALQHPDDEDNKVYLEVERSADDQVTVHGALRQKGQTAPLVVDSLAGVPSAINKAAKAGRIVGVEPNVLTFRRAA